VVAEAITAGGSTQRAIPVVMRARGVVGSVAGLGPSDHVCWIYGSDAGFRRFQNRALRFAADGLVLGQRLVYVSDRDPDDVATGLGSLGDVESLRRRGALAVMRPTDMLPAGPPVTDPGALLAAFHAAVEQAIGDGFVGIRVVAELGPFLHDPAWCGDQARWELVGDRYMAGPRPLAAMCAYDRRVIGTDGAALLACVHPVRHDGSASFSLSADGDALCLDGEVDVFQSSLLERALAAVPDWDPLVLDLGGLQFVDTAGTAVLASEVAARTARGAEVQVRRARPLVRRLWGLVGFDGAAVFR
jgi:anti-anti-sigma factor